MKALVLAAGRGQRMQGLTDNTPKPLLQAGGQSLIEHRLIALKAAGIRECVINIAYKGEQIQAQLGNGHALGIDIQYSNEGEQALESAGGIIQALPLLGPAPFIVVNADIWTDFDFGTLPMYLSKQAHLVLVDNPSHHPAGDFALNHNIVTENGETKLTYSGIAIFEPALFAEYTRGKRALRPVLAHAMHSSNVTGHHYEGVWQDIGTPERLHALQKMLA